jgi:hypothetical protein
MKFPKKSFFNILLVSLLFSYNINFYIIINFFNNFINNFKFQSAIFSPTVIFMGKFWEIHNNL